MRRVNNNYNLTIFQNIPDENLIPNDNKLKENNFSSTKKSENSELKIQQVMYFCFINFILYF